MNAKRQVYLDHAATTPIDPKVQEAMMPYVQEHYGNPSSFHMLGKRVKDAIDQARSSVANILGARPDEVVFTSGGTESDNLAVLGIARKHQEIGRHIVSAKTEHPAVLEALEQLEKEGFEVTYVPVDQTGSITMQSVMNVLREDTILVTLMYANNEIGTIHPIAQIGNAIQKYRLEKKSSFPLFHTDACQASGALELDVQKIHVDLMTINASKIYGPKGVGALYVKRGLKLTPLQFGGTQQRGLRAGTENVIGIIALANALELAQDGSAEESKRLVELRDYFIEKILSTIPKTRLNGHKSDRLPNNINISFMDIEGEALLLYLDAAGVYASTGSACTSASLDPSHVILAMNLPYEVAHGSIRFTLGRSTTKEDLDYVLEVLPGLVEKLRKISPVRVDEKYFE
jgi:cysteine desulfurase